MLMCHGELMQNKPLFEKFFKREFLTLVGDKVANVRILLAKALRHHFLKEIAGVFVEDPDFNEAVRVLKLDSCTEVLAEVGEIQISVTEKETEASERTVDEFVATLVDYSSDSGSINSEDEVAIENEIMRHDSEDELDHGPVL